MSGHSSLEKYTSHFIWKGSKGLLKVLLCERWIGDWSELQHIDLTSSSRHSSVSFSFSWAAQPEACGPALRWELVLTAQSGTLLQNSYLQLLNRGPEGPLCWILVLSTVSYLQLTDFLSSPGLYNCSSSTFFLWASQIALISTRHGPDIPRPDATVIYTGAFPILTAWPGLRSICNSYATHTYFKGQMNFHNKQKC